MNETLQDVTVEIVTASARSNWIFVAVQTGEGRTGWGESTIAKVHERTRATAISLGAQMKGQTVAAALAHLSIQPGDDAAVVAAKCGLDQALHDLEAQRRGVSVAEVLGGARTPSVEIYANINRRTMDRSPEAFAQSARAAVEAGNTAVKIAPFDRVQPHMDAAEARPLLDDAFARITRVREAIGPERRLLVDCHERLELSMIDEVLQVCWDNDLFWLEMPILETPERYADIAAVRAKANARGLRLAGGELKTGVEEFDPMFRVGLYDVIMPDLKHVGGYRQYLAVCELAVAAGVSVAPHNPSGPICHAHSVQACAATPNFLCLEMQFAETAAFTELCDPQPPMPHAGLIPTPRGPGLGTALKPEALAASRMVERP